MLLFYSVLRVFNIFLGFEFLFVFHLSYSVAMVFAADLGNQVVASLATIVMAAIIAIAALM